MGLISLNWEERQIVGESDGRLNPFAGTTAEMVQLLGMGRYPSFCLYLPPAYFFLSALLTPNAGPVHG